MKKMVCVALVIVAFYAVGYSQSAVKVLRQSSTINPTLTHERKKTDGFVKGAAVSKNQVRLFRGPRQYYQTWEYAEWLSLDREKKALRDRYSQSISWLLRQPNLTKAQRLVSKDSTDGFKSKIGALEKSQDSLLIIYNKDYLNFSRFNIWFGSKKANAFFQIITDNEDRFGALNSAGFTIGDQSASIYSEIFSGNLGFVRVGFGLSVSSSNQEDEGEEKQEEAYQRLVSKGGNTVLTFEYPLLYAHSRNNNFNLIARAVAKGTADLPAFGTSTDSWAGSGSLGLDIFGDAGLDNNEARFFVSASLFKIYGTDEFKVNLGTDSNNFTFGQIRLGMEFLQNYKISAIIYTFSTQEILEKRNVVLAGELVK